MGILMLDETITKWGTHTLMSNIIRSTSLEEDVKLLNRSSLLPHAGKISFDFRGRYFSKRIYQYQRHGSAEILDSFLSMQNKEIK